MIIIHDNQSKNETDSFIVKDIVMPKVTLRFFFLVLGFFLFHFIELQANSPFNYNLVSVEEFPHNAWINYIEIEDSTIIINISANNRINDTTYSNWINIDPQTFIQINEKKYNLLEVEGVAIAPNVTYFSHPNQTVSFNLKFQLYPIKDQSFSLIENETGGWKFKNIKLYQLSNTEIPNIYFAPHKVAGMLRSYSDSLMIKREYLEAIELNHHVLDFIEYNNIANTDMLKATAAYHLSGCYNRLNRDSLTVEYAKKVIHLYQVNNWRDDWALARAHGIAADVYSRNKNYYKAIDEGNEALRIKHTLSPKGSSDLALTYGKLSLYYEKVGDYDSAISYAEKGLRIREQISTEDVEKRLPVVTNLCRNYYIKQRFADALRLASSYKSENTKKISVDMYISLCAICSHSYQQIGKTEESLKNAQEGYKLIQQYYPKENQRLLNFINYLSVKERIRIQKLFLRNSSKDEFYFGIMQNLASDFFEYGKYSNAMKIQSSCIKQREYLKIRNTAKECEGNNRLLWCFYFSNDIAKYLNKRDSCFSQTERVFGKYSYEYADLLKIDYLYLYDSEKYYEAIIKLNEMLDIYKFLIIRDFPLLSYDDRESLWSSLTEWFDNIYLKCHKNALSSSSSKIGELNGLLYDNILFSKGLLLNSQVANKAHNLMKTDLSILNNSRIYSDTISALLHENLYNSYSDIQSVLEPNSIAIEFIQSNSTDDIIALCLLPEDEFPVLCFVCKTNELNEKIQSPSTSINDYCNLIWGNLSSYIKGKTKIYISLDDKLNIIPIENYIASNWIEPNTSIYRVSSTRQLLRPFRKMKDDYLLIGGLHYSNKTSMKFDDLQESLNEVEQISRLLTNNKIQHSLLYGEEGTKENVLLQLQNNHSIVHISTHSYYWQKKHTTNKDIAKTISILELDNHTTDKRLVRSGLILSSSTNNAQDQILTSYDIASLNLNNIGLIVLPSCKSGLGDITRDGVIGLQRAFKEAQVDAILMSLWDADDFSTRLLTVEFYKNIVSGLNLHESLQNAQEYIKNYEDESGNRLFESPYYWAGFVLLDALE